MIGKILTFFAFYALVLVLFGCAAGRDPSPYSMSKWKKYRPPDWKQDLV